MPDTLSVAIASYMGERYLLEQLQSIAAQSVQPDEIVICDDLSTDNTLKIASQFAEKNGIPLRTSANPRRLGISGNFAAAIGKCTGQIIAIADQDDVWQPNHLERLVAALNKPGALCATSNSQCVDENLNPLGQNFWQISRMPQRRMLKVNEVPWQFSAWIAMRSAVAGHAMAIRRSLVEMILPFVDTWHYDVWLTGMAAACGGLVVIPDLLTLHRHHGAQSSGHRIQSFAASVSSLPQASTPIYDREIESWNDLRDRLARFASRLPEADRTLHRLDEQLDFLRRRRTMRETPSRKLPISLSLLFSGKYHRLARGWLSFAHDVMK